MLQKYQNSPFSAKLFAIFADDYVIGMADNYLEKRYEELQARKAKEQRAKQIAWKKRMDAYRKKLEALQKEASPQSEGPPADGQEQHPEPGV